MKIVDENTQPPDLRLRDLDAGDVFRMPENDPDATYIALDQDEHVGDGEGDRIRAVDLESGYPWRSDAGDEVVQCLDAHMQVNGLYRVKS